MPEQYLTKQMITDLDDIGFTTRYQYMIDFSQFNHDKWSLDYKTDDTAPIYWYIKCHTYLLNASQGHDPKIKCKYVSVIYRFILEYKFVLDDPKWPRLKTTTIEKARQLREDPYCTDECKDTLNLFLSIIN